MTQKKPNTNWLVWMVKVALVTAGVSILWSFFHPPAVPPQNPPRMYLYSTVESPAEADSPAESDAEYEIRKRAVISRMTEILKILRRRPHAW